MEFSDILTMYLISLTISEVSLVEEREARWEVIYTLNSDHEEVQKALHSIVEESD